MKRLYVVRHAKASYPNDVSDYNRPLAKQGIEDIQSLSYYLKSKKFIPECILTSAATRTLETCHIISNTLSEANSGSFFESSVCVQRHKSSLQPPPAGTKPTIVSTKPITIFV